MPIFTIAFERRNSRGNHDYRPLFQELQAQKCFPLFETSWLGSFNNDATQIHNHFKRLMHEDDPLVVCEMTNRFCYSNAEQGGEQVARTQPSCLERERKFRRTGRAARLTGGRFGSGPGESSREEGGSKGGREVRGNVR